MKSFFKNLSLVEWLVIVALAMFAIGGFSREANAGDRGRHHHQNQSWNRHDWGRFAAGVAIGAAVTAPAVVYAAPVPVYTSPCPGARSCYDYPSYYSPSPYAAGWSAIIKPTVVYHPVPAYPSGQVVATMQPGEAERLEAEAASRQADQARQLIDLATRAGDRAQVERGIVLLREAASNATAVATVAREIAFHEVRGPFAAAATSNAQQAQSAADRISQALQQYAPTTTGQGRTR